MTRTRIVLAPAGPAEAPTYWLLDALGEIVGRGEVAVGAPPPAGPHRDVLIVPGAEAVARWLHLPTRNERQARAAAALQLSDQLALPGEEVHIALGPLEPDDRRLVVVVARSAMQGWLSGAALHGVRPEIVVPDHLALAEPAPGEPLVTAALGPILAARGPRFAASFEAELAPVVLADREARALTEREFEAMLVQTAGRAPVNLLQGEFAPASAFRPEPRALRRIAVLAGLALLSPLVLSGAEIVRHQVAAQRIEARTAARVAQVLPKGQAVNDPAGQAAAQLETLQLAAGGGPVGLAARLFAALEGIDAAQLESLMLAPDGSLRAQISYANVTDIELTRAALRRTGVLVREEGAREEGGRAISDIILGARP